MHVFAHAVLTADGRYVLQHRDDKPGIAAPGAWSLFGGRVEVGELPNAAMAREIREELCLCVDDWRELWNVERYSEFVGAVAQYSFFEADISTLWGRHRLVEGQAVERFTYEQISGLRMSPVMRETLQRHHQANGARRR